MILPGFLHLVIFAADVGRLLRSAWVMGCAAAAAYISLALLDGM